MSDVCQSKSLPEKQFPGDNTDNDYRKEDKVNTKIYTWGIYKQNIPGIYEIYKQGNTICTSVEDKKYPLLD